MRQKLLSLVFLLIASTATAGEEGMTQSITEVKAKYTEQLMALPGVVSVGIGRDDEGHKVIMVGLDSAQPEVADKIPQELDSYPVIIQVIGPVKAR